MADKIVIVSPGDKETVGVFTTAQSFVTFPVASSLVTICLEDLGKSGGITVGEERNSRFIIALVIGMSIYGMSHVKGNSLSEKFTVRCCLGLTPLRLQLPPWILMR